VSSVLRAPPAAGLAPREAERGPLRGFGRRHLILVLLFAVLTPLTFALFAAATGERMHAAPVLAEMITYLAIGCATMLSALATDNLLRHRVGPAWTLTVAVLAASVLGTALTELATHAVIGPLGLNKVWSQEAKGVTSFTHRLLLEFVGAARWSLILIALYELLETNLRASEELHAARRTALASQQNLVEGELRAMQARVDPDLLFDALQEVDRAYALDVGAGQERLDALIRFLRAASPGVGASTSTVARELELADAYVALLGPRNVSGPRLDLSVDPATRHESLPPMLLLPLVRWALAGGSARRIRLAVQRQATGLAITVEADADAGGTSPDGGLEAVRERLAQLYSQGARLSIQSGAGSRRAVLEIPLPQSSEAQRGHAA